MIKNINIINGEIQWSELVGTELVIRDYKIICIGYNKTSSILQIAEYRTEKNYTNEIVVLDVEKTISILKSFNIDIKLIQKFTWSQETLTKVRGLEQAGFTYVIYDLSKDTALLDGKMEMNIFKKNELLYIKQNNIDTSTVYNNNIIIKLSDIN